MTASYDPRTGQNAITTAPPATNPVVQQPPQSQWAAMPPPVQTNQYGGQQIVGSTPSQADYASVDRYSDAAHDEARRYLDPQQAQQQRRLSQEQINRGVDPNSAQGQEMGDMLSMRQGDQNNAAAFGAMQFGQGIQNQMSQQELANQALGGQMQQGLWNAENQYGQLDFQQNMGEHTQMMDMLGYGQQDRMLQDALYNQQYSSVPLPSFSATNPYAPANTMMGAGDTTWWNAGAEQGWGW